MICSDCEVSLEDRFTVQSSEFRVWDLGFRVLSVGGGV